MVLPIINKILGKKDSKESTEDVKSSAAKSIVDGSGTVGKVAKDKISNDVDSSIQSKPESNIKQADPVLNEKDDVKSVLNIAVNYLASISNTINTQLDIDRKKARDQYYNSKEDLIERVTKKQDATSIMEEKTANVEKEKKGFMSILSSIALPIITVIGGIAAVVGSIIGFGGEAKAADIDKHVKKPKRILNGDATRVSSGSTKNSATKLESKEQRESYAKKFFIDKGYNNEQAAGIVGNLSQESLGLNHKQKQIGGGPGYGIAQWEKPRQKLFKKTMGIDIKDSTLDQQLEFVNWELNNTEKRAKRELKKTKSAKQAAVSFRKHYERAGVPHDNVRIANAKRVEKLPTGNLTDNKSVPVPDARPQLREDNNEEAVEKFDDFVKGPSIDSGLDLLSSGAKALITNIKGAIGNDSYYKGSIEEITNQNKSKMINANMIKQDNYMLKDHDHDEEIKINLNPSQRLQSVNSGSLDVINPNYKIDESSIVSSYLKTFNMTGNLAQ